MALILTMLLLHQSLDIFLELPQSQHSFFQTDSWGIRLFLIPTSALLQVKAACSKAFCLCTQRNYMVSPGDCLEGNTISSHIYACWGWGEALGLHWWLIFRGGGASLQIPNTRPSLHVPSV